MDQKQYEDLTAFLIKVKQLKGTHFDSNKTIFINRCPGRLDLMGGNDDYTGGLVFESTIKETTIFAAQPRSDEKFVLLNPSVKSMNWTEKIEFSLNDLRDHGEMKPIEKIREFVNADSSKSWFTYIVGGLCYLLKNAPQKISHGLNMYLDSNIPLGKGVSSSAALETSALKACAAAYGMEITGIPLAQATQWVECEISGAAAGIMDQFAVVMGNENIFTPMLCQPCIALTPVKLPTGMKIWGIDSGVRHSVSGIAYEAARTACFMGYQYLCEWERLSVTKEIQGPLTRYTDPKWDGYLARVTPTVFRSLYESRLPEQITGAEFRKDHPVHFDPYTTVRNDVTYPVRKATRYAVEENYRVSCFYEILKGMSETPTERSYETLAELMYGAHLGYSDCNLGCDETDMLVSMVHSGNYPDLYGAKITGGGAGGTVAVLGKDTPAGEASVKCIFETYQKQTGNQPWLFEGSTQGADAFGILQIMS